MHRFMRLLRRLFNTVRPEHAEGELSREIDAHQAVRAWRQSDPDR
jgi:hypothetical protein